MRRAYPNIDANLILHCCTCYIKQYWTRINATFLAPFMVDLVNANNNFWLFFAISDSIWILWTHFELWEIVISRPDWEKEISINPLKPDAVRCTVHNVTSTPVQRESKVKPTSFFSFFFISPLSSNTCKCLCHDFDQDLPVELIQDAPQYRLSCHVCNDEHFECEIVWAAFGPTVYNVVTNWK